MECVERNEVEKLSTDGEVERVIYKRKVVDRKVGADGSDKIVSVGEKVITVSPDKFCKFGRLFIEKCLYGDALLAQFSCLVMDELMSGKFGNQVYLFSHEGMTSYAFRKGLKLAVESGLLFKTDRPHIYNVNRTYIQYGKEKR